MKKVKLTAVLIREGVRYERDLAPHFMRVQFNRMFPHRNEAVAAFRAWADRESTYEPRQSHCPR
jgi:hypothetical protein